ncbi:MAG: helix-turn-helix domain-containing protein [Opitutales bacterium]|nr:helix-turn-helix domain-containing protein [Opitutales bacterium]MCH8539807.1 helix-turn-helix domain-containing protein [Opitutales bacterium]
MALCFDTQSDVGCFDVRSNIILIDIETNVIFSFQMNQNQAVRSPQDLGQLIAQARRQRGQSQRQLAAEFGVTQAWLSRVERGHQKTWIGQVFRLAVYLGIELTAQTPASKDASSESKNSPAGDYPDINQLI